MYAKHILTCLTALRLIGQTMANQQMANQQVTAEATSASSAVVNGNGRDSAAQDKQSESEAKTYFHFSEVCDSQQGREALVKQLLRRGAVVIGR